MDETEYRESRICRLLGNLGFGSLAVPVALPRFPVSLSDLNELKDSSGA